MPGITVGGIPLGGLTLQQASAVIDHVWNVEYRIDVVDSHDSSVGWQVAPSEFGLGVDAQTSAELAFARGRGTGVVQGVLDMIDAWLNGWSIQPWVSYDPIAARDALESWSTRMDVAPVDADFSVHAGEIIPVTAQQGRRLDRFVGWVQQIAVGGAQCGDVHPEVPPPALVEDGTHEVNQEGDENGIPRDVGPSGQRVSGMRTAVMHWFLLVTVPGQAFIFHAPLRATVGAAPEAPIISAI